MFTGLIEEVGTVMAVCARDHGMELQIAAPRTAKHVCPGESIAVNGCCLTLTSCRGDRLTFDLLEETIARTNLKKLQQNNTVNLERALRADRRLGGHFMQGHVDCASAIAAFDAKCADFRLEIELPKEFAHYVAFKGSIALNGISLTVAEPYTMSHTNLDRAKAGDLAALENVRRGLAERS
jgi:riboflavin synthase